MTGLVLGITDPGDWFRLVEQFIRSAKIAITPALFYQDDLRRRLMITLNMTKVVQHIWQAIDFENAEAPCAGL